VTQTQIEFVHVGFYVSDTTNESKRIKTKNRSGIILGSICVFCRKELLGFFSVLVLRKTITFVVFAMKRW
jgi:hypothetical protein